MQSDYESLKVGNEGKDSQFLSLLDLVQGRKTETSVLWHVSETRIPYLGGAPPDVFLLDETPAVSDAESEWKYSEISSIQE